MEQRRAPPTHRERRFDPDTKYVSLWEMSMILHVQPAVLSRWVKMWFDLGDVPIRRAPRGKSYSIPTTYALVGQGWKLEKDAWVRDVMLDVLPDDPKPWLVVVGKRGITCYTADEASQQVTSILTGDGIPDVIKVFHVGEVPTVPLPKR